MEIDAIIVVAVLSFAGIVATAASTLTAKVLWFSKGETKTNGHQKTGDIESSYWDRKFTELDKGQEELMLALTNHVSHLHLAIANMVAEQKVTNQLLNRLIDDIRK